MPVSDRARHLLKGTSPLVAAHFRAAADPWDPDTNPDGFINLGTSEQHLLWDHLGPLVHAAATGTAGREAEAHYGLLHGTPRLRAAVARHLERQGWPRVDPEALVVVSGASAALEILGHALFEPGDAVLIPTPYYSGFETCFKTRAGLRIAPCHLRSGEGHVLTVEALERAYRAAAEAGHPPRGLVLCSPQNPLGTIDAPEAMQEQLAWAREHDLEIIVDEIYAHTVHDPETSSWRPVRAVDDARAQDVHVVGGVAKDLGLSGWKTGWLHSTDPEVLEAARSLAYLAPVSTLTQGTVARILEDQEAVDRVLAMGRERLAQAYQVLAEALDDAGIPHQPAQAGLFAWMDLRPLLTAPTWDAEMALYERIVEEARVNLSPGSVFHGAEPGWFRLCYAQDEVSVLEAVDRVAAVGRQGAN